MARLWEIGIEMDKKAFLAVGLIAIDLGGWQKFYLEPSSTKRRYKCSRLKSRPHCGANETKVAIDLREFSEPAFDHGRSKQKFGLAEVKNLEPRQWEALP